MRDPTQDKDYEGVSQNQGISGFVAKEASRRFPLPPVPIHLEEWSQDHELDDQNAYGSGFQELRRRPSTEIDAEPTPKKAPKQDTGLTLISEDDQEEASSRSRRKAARQRASKKGRRDELVEKMSSSFRTALERNGRPGLASMKDAVQARLSDEEQRIGHLQTVLQYRDFLLQSVCPPPDDDERKDSIWQSTEDIESPPSSVDVRDIEPALSVCSPDGVIMECYSVAAGSGVYGLRIRVSDETLSKQGIDPSTLPERETRFETRPLPSTWTELSSKIKERFQPYLYEKRAAEEVVGLLHFRSALLDRYMWAFDVSGVPPTLTGAFHVPEELRSMEQSLKHALTSIEVLKRCVEEDMRPDSQRDLIREIEERVSPQEREVSGESVLKGAKRILGKFPHAPETDGDRLFRVLLDYEDKILRVAENVG